MLKTKAYIRNNKFFKLYKRTGFTLAEVLVTLAIIGIVAALTVPSLITNIQENQTKTALKKAYSVISQATAKIKDDNGGTMLNLCGTTGYTSGSPDICTTDNTSHNYVGNLYKNHMSVIKSCSAWANDTNCNYAYLVKPYSDNPGSYGPYNFWGSRLLLADNILLGIRYYYPNCDGSNPSLPYCGTIEVDINGIKQPNKFGYDVFIFYITKNSIVPMGSSGDYYENQSRGCNNNGTDDEGVGYGCAARVLMQ